MPTGLEVLANLQHLAKQHADENALPPSSGRTSIYCTSLSRAHECLRKAVLEITHCRSSLVEPLSDETKRIFAIGKLLEPAVRAFCYSVGVNIEDEQRRLTDGADVLPVSGRIDFRVGGVLCELKTIGAYAWPKLVAHLDAGGSMLDSPSAWHEHWYRQVQCYLWLSEEQQAVMVFWRKDALDVRTCLVERNDAVIEHIRDLSKEIRFAANRVNGAIAATATRDNPTGDLMAESVLALLPPHPSLDEDPPCSDCTMRRVCLPGARFKLTSTVCDDLSILDAIAGADRLTEAAKEKEKLRDYAVSRFNAYREANMPTAQEYYLLFPDGSRFGCKQQKDGKWVPKFRPAKREEEAA